MMYRVRVVIFIIMITFITNFFNMKVYGENKEAVLLVYSDQDKYVEDEINSFIGLIDRFDVDVIEISEKDYKTGMIEKFNYVFFMGLSDKINNESIIGDFKGYKGKLFWMGNGIDQFLEGNENISLKYTGIKYDFISVLYENKNKVIPLEEEFHLGLDRKFIKIDHVDDKAKVYAWLNDGKDTYPYIIQENNFWYVSRFESTGILFYILADVLYDLFEVTEYGENQIYVKISDIDLLKDIGKLKGIGDFLYSKNIPFMIELMPDDVEGGDFDETIRYLQSKGGSVVQNVNVKNTISPYSYSLYHTQAVEKLLSGNIEYESTNPSSRAHEILEKYNEMSIVRGHIAGLVFNHFLNLKELEQVIEALPKDSQFLDLRKINSGDLINNKDYNEDHNSEGKNIEGFRGITNYMAVFVGVFCVVLVVILVVSKIRDRKNIFR